MWVQKWKVGGARCPKVLIKREGHRQHLVHNLVHAIFVPNVPISKKMLSGTGVRILSPCCFVKTKNKNQ